MPQIYYLNPPPNPFWDFVAGLEDHPFLQGPPRHQPRGRFARYGPSSPPPHPSASGPTQPATEPAAPGMSEKAQGKQPYVEDPPEVDPATIKPETQKSEETEETRNTRFRGRGRFAHAFEGDDDNSCRRFRHDRERRCGGRGGARGPAMFPFGRAPWGWQAPPMPPNPAVETPPPHGPAGLPHMPPHHRGPHGPCGPHDHHDRRGPHGPHGPHRRPSPPHDRPRGPHGGFDLGGFLNNLGNKLGVDLSGAAEGLGLDRFAAGRTGQETDFEPRSDIFENADLYTIHLSLPGAKKEDIGVDYDGEHSVLRITGVVHRPGVDEKMLSELVVDGRKRETGVFEKAIRLGTKRDPANIDVAGISAKMTDGVLVVRIPKVEKAHERREVPITASPSAADYEDDYSEKPVLFDAEDHASVAGTTTSTAQREEISLIDMKDNEEKHVARASDHDVEKSAPVESTKDKKVAESGQEKEAPKTTSEQLPAYSASNPDEREDEDWENFSDHSGEGEYVKIDIK